MPQDRGSLRVNGPAIRFVRSQRGFSTRELARRAGIAQPWLVQLENGTRTGMRREKFDDLVAALEVDPRVVLADPSLLSAA